MLITRALYRIKSAGTAFRSFLAITLDDMGFQPSDADPDVWMQPAVKPDKEKYYGMYKYMLTTSYQFHIYRG